MGNASGLNDVRAEMFSEPSSHESSDDKNDQQRERHPPPEIAGQMPALSAAAKLAGDEIVVIEILRSVRQIEPVIVRLLFPARLCA